MGETGAPTCYKAFNHVRTLEANPELEAWHAGLRDLDFDGANAKSGLL